MNKREICTILLAIDSQFTAICTRSQAPAWECRPGSSSFQSCEAGASTSRFPSWSLGTRRTVWQIGCWLVPIVTGGVNGKFAHLPALPLLQRLHDRNEYLNDFEIALHDRKIIIGLIPFHNCPTALVLVPKLELGNQKIFFMCL